MREIKHSALVAQPPARLFALINDIESYPSFIPWCTHAKVLSKSDREIIATISRSDLDSTLAWVHHGMNVG